jgi:hypothetical protein
MTDELRQLEQRLEQATAQCSRSEAPLEPETAALREGWLAFGELLEAAQEVSQQRLPSPPAPTTSWCPPQAGEGSSAASVLPQAGVRSRWLPITMVALAASVLIALVVAWHVGSMKPIAIPSVPEIAKSHPAPPAPAGKQTPIAAVEVEIAWDDSLDQKIEQTGWEVAQVQQDWLAAAAPSGLVQYQLEQVKKDIEDSPL